MAEIIARSFMHSCYLRSKFGSSVIIKEKIQYDDGRLEPNIYAIENPKRSFYITQPRYRNYKFKPEFELLSRLDKYTCFDHELEMKIAELFQLGHGYIRKDKLFKSPYIFGADISIEALIKMYYLDKYPEASIIPSVGFLDIETSIDTEQIILISYIHDNVVHTAVLDAFLYEEINGKRIKVSKEDLIRHVQTNLSDFDEKVTKLNLTYDIEVFENEIKLIAWIMQKIHQSEIDFIGIWNMNFDIPKILNTITKYNYDPATLFISPKLDRKYRYLKYHEDKRDVHHFSLRWHWLYSTCGSQFIDSLGLFSQNRRTAGFRDRYTLDAVLSDEVGMRKLPLVSGSHTVMQRNHFKDYVVYNIFDVIGLRLLEDKNNDVLSMTVLTGSTPVSRFATQTTRATNAIYHALIGKGMVLSSCSNEDDFVKMDRLFGRAGGAVLPSSRVRGVGISLTI